MDAQNAGNDISGIQNSPRPPPPIHAWYIGHTHGFQPLLSPSNILSHRKVSFQKMPPHGKILKKGPAVNYQADINASIIEINTIAENIDRTDMSNVENKDDRLKEIRKQKGCPN